MAVTPSLARIARMTAMTPVLLASVLALTLAVPAHAGSGDGYLGVYLQEIDDALAAALDLDDAAGVLVKDVVEDSPAEKAGLQTGDIVLSVDGKEADDVASFTRRIRRHDPGEKVELAILRKGEKKTLEVELGEAENTFAVRRFDGEGPHGFFRGEDGDVQIFGDEDVDIEILGEDGDERVIVRGLHMRPQLGVQIHEFDEDLGKYFGAKSGVLVLDVIEDSAAEKAGLKPGDVITSIDGDEVEESADVFEVLEDHEAGDKVAVEILRDKKKQKVEVELDESDAFDFARGENMFFGRRGMHDGNHFRWKEAPRAPRHPELRHERREMLREHRGELREELDQLREELQQLREQLEKEGER